MKFEKFNSIESNILKEIFKDYPLMDDNISYIIESFIYYNVIEYYSKNKIRTKYTKRFNKKHGEYKEWDTYNTLILDCNYKNDKLDGKYKEFNIAGILNIECFYENNLLHGIYKKWNDYGTKNYECYYKYGKREGEFKSWCNKGHKIIECFYKDGKRDG